MSADLLRSAAEQIREDVANMADETGSEPDEFLLAVASWLAHQATYAARAERFEAFSERHFAAPFLIARAYLAQMNQTGV